MPRPLRDQAAGIVHLIWRGNRRQRIFDDDVDRDRYLLLLTNVSHRFGWRIPAYCLMKTHVHLMARVTEGTLSRGMQLLGGRYAQAYNMRHDLVGHLFQGRFRSERVEDDAYALELIRYIDLNPERAGAAEAKRWRWSSHRALLGLERPRPFHDVEWTLAQFGVERAQARRAYAAFVADGRAKPLPQRRNLSRMDSPWGLTPRRVPTGQVYRVLADQPTQ